MKHKIIWGLFVLLFPLSAMSKVVDYCKVISFDSGAFDIAPIKLKSLDRSCINSSVPIFYNRIKHYFWLFNEASQDKHLYYLKFNSKSKRYEYDLEELNFFLNEVDSRYDIKDLKRKMVVKETPKETGVFFEFTVVFYDNKDKPYSMLKTLLFSSKDSYSAIYHSDLIEYQNKKEMDYINRVVELFQTIDNIFDKKEHAHRKNFLEENEEKMKQEKVLFCASDEDSRIIITQANTYSDTLMDGQQTERYGYLHIIDQSDDESWWSNDIYKIKILISAIDDTRANVVIYRGNLPDKNKEFFYSTVDINNYFDDVMSFDGDDYRKNYLFISSKNIFYGDDIKEKCLTDFSRTNVYPSIIGAAEIKN